ncbi:MAG: SET domain-containing protein-lysine N-methyltransferase, partial [Fibrobacterota bacterium]
SVDVARSFRDKDIMKQRVEAAGIRVPHHTRVRSRDEARVAAERFGYPVILKPIDGAGSADTFRVNDARELEVARARTAHVTELSVEEFVDGREFTVLVAAEPNDRNRPIVLCPLEFCFPNGETFKSYDLKITQHHPECNVPVSDPDLDAKLREAARRVFVGFDGEGYARLDFRMDRAGALHFLDINFACSIFYPHGSEGSADYILRNDSLGASGFLTHIVREGISRHAKNRRNWVRKGNSSAGYGIFANRNLAQGEVVFAGEEGSFRLISRGRLESNWTAEEQDTARHYAIPFSSELLAIWNRDPDNWAPQNHSCDANTAYQGLDVVAVRDIAQGQELTLDYSNLCDDSIPAFSCRCGAGNCRGTVAGTAGFSLTAELASERARSRD